MDHTRGILPKAWYADHAGARVKFAVFGKSINYEFTQSRCKRCAFFLGWWESAVILSVVFEQATRVQAARANDKLCVVAGGR